MRQHNVLSLLGVLLVTLWATLSTPLHAQETAAEPLVMSFTTIKPFAHTGPDGRPSGFSVDLAEMIGAEIGVPVEFQYMPTIPDIVATQASGRAQFFAGVVQLPPLSQTNVFSDPVASETLLFTVLASNRTAFSEVPIQNLRIGVVPPGLGSEEPILADNNAVEFQNVETALVSLLLGDVDALLIPPTTVYRLARAADIDGRLTFVGNPLQETTRHVALHESRAALLGPINEAIARLEADGRLPSLRLAYDLEVPSPPPDVLTVGVTNFGNYTIINDDGSVAGFAVELLQDLAELAHLELRFTPITSEEWASGPGLGPFDMLPQISVSAERASRMDFTLPIERGAFGIFMRQGETEDVLGLNDLLERPVAIQEVSRTYRDAQNAGMTNIVTFDDLEPMIAALEREEVDAFLYSVEPVEEFIEQTGGNARVEMVQPAYLQVERAIALRPGLGSVREQLNAVIPGYVISDEYAALHQKYFGLPLFWTPTRIYTAIGLGAAVALCLMALLYVQRQRQRMLVYAHQQRELEREQAHTETLGKVITELERSNRELDEFAYTASHDLKEPLRGIAINANFLAREQLSEKGNERVDRMLLLAKRMEQLVSDLLFFSRLGRGEKVMKNVDTSHIVEGVEKELKEWMTERRGKIQYPADLPWIYAERSKVKTVFQNLIVNALKYNDADTKTVEVGYSPEATVNKMILRDVFWVRDNGIGIADQYRDKIFRIFQRLNREELYGVGTGAGLSFVRKIIEEYGGTITFESDPESGTTFYFSMPLAKIKSKKT